MTARGGAAGKGVIYSFSDGIPVFPKLVNRAGAVGASANILGTGFSTASSVKFNGMPASFHVISDSYMTWGISLYFTSSRFDRCSASNSAVTSCGSSSYADSSLPRLVMWETWPSSIVMRAGSGA